MFSTPNDKGSLRFNSNSQLDLITQIQLLSQKISQLEDSNNNLSQLLNDEISQRQN